MGKIYSTNWKQKSGWYWYEYMNAKFMRLRFVWLACLGWWLKEIISHIVAAKWFSVKTGSSLTHILPKDKHFSLIILLVFSQVEYLYIYYELILEL